MRRVLVQAAIGLVLVSAALVGLALAIDQGWQRHRLLDWASRELALALGVEVDVGRSVGRLTEGLDLRDVRLGAAEAPVLTIDRLRVAWQLDRTIETHALVVERVEVEGWTAWFERDLEGRWSGPHTLGADGDDPAAPPSEPAGPTRIDRIEIGPGLVHLAAPADGRLAGVDLAPLAGVDRVVLEAEGQVRGLSLAAQSAPGIDAATLELRLVDALSPNDRALVDALNARVELDGERNLSADLLVRGPSIDVEAELEGTRERIEGLRARFDVGTASPFVAWIPALAGSAGRATGTIEATGPWPSDVEPFDPIAYTGRAEIDASVTALPDAWRARVPPGAAEVDAALRWSNGALAVQRLTARHAAGLDLSATGTLGSAAFEGLSVRAEIDRAEAWLAVQPETESLGLSGPVSLSAQLDGAFDAPTGSIELTSGGLHLGERALGPVAVTARRRDERAGRVDLVVGSPDRPVLEASALLSADLGTATLDATGDLGALPEIEGFDPADTPSGRVRFDGRLARDQGALRLDGVLTGKALAWRGRPVGDARVDLLGEAPIAFDRGAIQVPAAHFEGPWGRATLANPARLALDPDGRWSASTVALDLDPALDEGSPPEARPPARVAVAVAGRGDAIDRVTLQSQGLPVAWITDALPEVPSLGGRVDADARLGIADGRLETQGWIALDTPRYETFEAETLRADWRTEAERVDLRLTAEAFGGVPLSIEARVPAPTDLRPSTLRRAARIADIDARLDGFDLAALAALTPRTLREPSGRLEGTFRRRVDPVTGRADFDGRLRLRDGAITVPLLRRRFSPITGDVQLVDGRLVLDALELGDEQAGARLTGTVELGSAARTPIDARLSLQALPISRSPLFASDATGRLQWTGTLQQPVLRGDITLSDTRIRVPAADDRVLREIRFVTHRSDGRLVEPAASEPDFVASSDLDVEIRVPSDTRIRGQGAHLWVEGTARLRSRPGEPLRVVGEGRVVNGTYTLQGRRFRVQRGEVRLVGDEQLDPVLDVVAELPINDIIAIVDVGGRLSSPVVRLRSSPPMSEQDVLAYLIFGRPAESVGAAGGTRFDAAAARLVAGVAEAELREVLGDSMPVDSIEIGTNDEGEANTLGFGKYLRPDLHFRYVHVLGDEPADRVGVEYRLNDLLSIGSSVSTTGDAGLDLILRHDF